MTLPLALDTEAVELAWITKHWNSLRCIERLKPDEFVEPPLHLPTHFSRLSLQDKQRALANKIAWYLAYLKHNDDAATPDYHRKTARKAALRYAAKGWIRTRLETIKNTPLNVPPKNSTPLSYAPFPSSQDEKIRAYLTHCQHANRLVIGYTALIASAAILSYPLLVSFALITAHLIMGTLLMGAPPLTLIAIPITLLAVVITLSVAAKHIYDKATQAETSVEKEEKALAADPDSVSVVVRVLHDQIKKKTGTSIATQVTLDAPSSSSDSFTPSPFFSSTDAKALLPTQAQASLGSAP